jgi:putative FmdB family regulatory protein
MPIYEYECRACRHRFEQLIIHSTTAECPSCRGRDLDRLVSLFGVNSEATRGSALRDGRRRQDQTTRDHNDAEIAYHRKHDDH